MSDGHIKIDIEIDGKPLKSILTDFKELESTAKKSASGPDELKKSIVGLDGKPIKAVSSDVKELGSESKTTNKDIGGVKDSLKDVDGKPIKDVASDFKELGEASKKASSDTKNLGEEAGKAVEGVSGVSKELKKVDSQPIEGADEKLKQFTEQAKKGEKSVNDFTAAMLTVKAAAVVFNVLKDAMDGAIKRFDTLERFPKVLESMGFEASHSQRAMERMANSIEGLPTTLNDMVDLTQKFVNITGDLDKSVDTAEALNNAMMASGSSSADAARGIEQYSQMLSNGEPDMQSWRSVNETMGYGLKRTAEEMLGAGHTAMDLYAALKSGELTMDAVNDKIIELGGSTGELATLARENSAGIQTSFANLKNAAVKGLANVMKSLNKVSEAATGKTIAKNLDSMKALVNKTFDAINKTIIKTTPLVKALGVAFQGLSKTANVLSPAIKGVFVAFVGIKIVERARKIFNDTANTIELYRRAQEALKLGVDSLTAAKAREVLGLKASNKATVEEMAAMIASNSVITTKTALIGLLTKQITLVQFAKLMWAKVTTVLTGALNALAAHPIIAFIAGMTVALTAAVKINQAMNKEFYEAQKAMQELTNEVVENAKATKDNIRKRQTNVENMEKEVMLSKGLADRLGNLTKAEKATTEQKKEILETVTELNRLYPDLNIQYDENTNKVNKNATAIKAQIDAMTSYDRVIAIQENMVESVKELNEAEEEAKRIAGDLAGVRKDVSESNDLLLWKNIQLMKSEKELMEQEDANNDRRKTLVEEQKMYLEQQEEARQAALEAQKAVVREVGLQYDFLSDSQKKMVDTMKGNYRDLLGSATSFTKDLTFELEMTGQEFINFVAKNQEIMSQWGENMRTLTERGVNEGFLAQLQSMGPEGAMYAQLAVNMTDDEFNRLNDVFGNAPKISEDAWKKAYGLENIPDAVTSLVKQTELSMSTQFDISGINLLLENQGKQNVQSYADGMNDNQDVIKKATENVMNATVSPEQASATKENFKEVGAFVPQGLAEGILSNSSDATSAVEDMSADAVMAARTALEVHSPSRKFVEIGKFVVEGLVNGIKNNNNLVVSAMNQMNQTITSGGNKLVATNRRIADMIPQQFNGLSGRMTNIGYQAMQGLTNGINGGAGGAVSAAANVASQIKSTIQSALDIHSPSRWMRDKIGRFIPQGIALGIEQDSYRAIQAMESLTADIGSITPELALSAHNFGYTTPSSSSGSTTSNSYSNSFKGMLDGATFHIREEADIDKLADKLVGKISESRMQSGRRVILN